MLPNRPVRRSVRFVLARRRWKDVLVVPRMLPPGNDFAALLAKSQHRCLVTSQARYRVLKEVVRCQWSVVDCRLSLRERTFFRGAKDDSLRTTDH
jgi:hypothetical protein